MIEAESLVKRFGAFDAVQSVSFRVERGQIVGLLGPNGAGKTTIMRMLTCYHLPTSGTARVDSHDVVAEPLLARRSIGYLPENAPLYNDMKVREYLGFIADARGLAGARKRGGIERVVDACGLSDVFDRDIRRLSKGYRQRTGLAQAILHDPSVLVLDEPTTGLDPNQILEIRALIRSLGAEKTVILSTHILPEVEAVCTRVLIMNGGRLVAQGTARELARGLKENVTLLVVFKGQAGGSLAGELSALPGVISVAPVRGAGEERWEVELTAAAGGDPSEAVYDWAVATGRKILAMNTHATSLEELFSRLTTGEGGEHE